MNRPFGWVSDARDIQYDLLGMERGLVGRWGRGIKVRGDGEGEATNGTDCSP